MSPETSRPTKSASTSKQSRAASNVAEARITIAGAPRTAVLPASIRAVTPAVRPVVIRIPASIGDVHAYPKKLRDLGPEAAHEALVGSRVADPVHLFLRDGRVIEGAILFNEFKGTGRIINVEEEISIDFRVDEVRDVKY